MVAGAWNAVVADEGRFGAGNEQGKVAQRFQIKFFPKLYPPIGEKILSLSRHTPPELN